MDQKSNQPDPANAGQKGEGLPMPPLASANAQPSASKAQADANAPQGDVGHVQFDPLELPPPPTFGKQAAQLVIIPAAIVIAAIGFALAFGMLAGQETNIESELAKLEQSGGRGKMAGGLQDPRYKDRWLAAYNIATRIPSLKEPAERQSLNNRLRSILEQNVSADEEMIMAYLIMAIGQLGEQGGLEAVLLGASSRHARVQEATIGAILSWPDRMEARQVAVPALTRLLTVDDPRMVTQAAAAMGRIAAPGDAAAIASLRRTIEATGPGRREAQWNAAVALAILGDDFGVNVVTDVLLNREALDKLSADESGGTEGPRMARPMQNRIMVATLASAKVIDDPRVWAKVDELAASDPDMRIRKDADAVRQQRNRNERQAPPQP